MIDLDYEMDEFELRDITDDPSLAPHLADPAVLEMTYFEMPVRFVVNGTRVLGVEDRRWVALPLVGFSNWLMRSVQRREELVRTHPSSPTGDLVFQRRGDEVELRNPITRDLALCSLTELTSAAEAFHASVRQLLVSRFPLMSGLASWPEWFG